MAHRRDINTQGMAQSSAAADEDDNGIFGVLVSQRTGPLQIIQPTAVYVHVVSIEDVEQMTPWPIAPEIRFVALPSLYSWSYMCMPPNAANVFDEFFGLGMLMNVLTPPIPPEGTMDQVVSRMRNGFSLSRYRVQTGEQTACFIRGPFIPTLIPILPSYWTQTSMCGSDLQILDQDVGLMDVSYSAAWQLGRTLAIADRPFVASLCIVRKQIYDRGVEAARVASISKVSTFTSRRELLASISTTVANLNQIQGRSVDDTTLRQRWRRKNVEPVSLLYSAEDVDSEARQFMIQAALDVASTPKNDSPTQPSEIGYDEYNTPFSVDWVVVLRWVLDKFFLAGIPAHYLVTDSSHLPTECIRFFNVDSNRPNSLIDGALSLGNHIDQTEDRARDGMKAAINRYLTTPLTGLGYLPAIPRFGCYVRSALITKFPDLKIDITLAAQKAEPMLLRHEIVTPDTMLVLFTQPPSDTTWKTLSFTQPPHQQNFVAGESITYAAPGTQNIDPQQPSYSVAGIAEMNYRRAYTVPNPVDEHYKEMVSNSVTLNTKTGASPLYIWW